MSAYRTNSEPPFSEKIDNFKRKKFRPTEGLIATSVIIYFAIFLLICLLGAAVSSSNKPHFQTMNVIMAYIFYAYAALGALILTLSIVLFGIKIFIKHWKESFVDEQN